jgi:Zn-finger nucleic acid-binding protein
MEMNCPSCNAPLSDVRLESDLPAKRCGSCGGVWLDSNAYIAWHQAKRPKFADKTASESIAVLDTDSLKSCPNCQRLLMRYRVVPGERFYLDRCSTCHGLWLDKGEWETLVARSFHDNVHEFFTQPWQAKVRAEETRAMSEKLYQNRFGAEDYAKAQDVRAWLVQHPQRSMILAFLQAEDPYKV